MNKDGLHRQEKLYRLAEEDLSYNIWNRSHQDCKEAYEEFFISQPEHIQRILSGYVNCGLVALQRLVNIACENMVFTDEE